MAQAEDEGKSGRFWDLGWFLAWAFVSSVWCVTAANQFSATYDEPCYLDNGLKRWRTGSHHDLLTGGGIMPLPVDVETLPLALWERCRGAEFDIISDLDTLLPVARAGTLVFWWVLLIYGFCMGRSLVGRWGGRLAVALIACEPNLLAHAGLATTDLAVTACLLALCHHFRTGRDASWGWRVGVPGMWFAATLSSKASGLVLGSLCLLALEGERLLRRLMQQRLGWRQALAVFGSSIRDLAGVAVLGALLASFYCGNDRDPLHPLAEAWASWLPSGPLGQVLAWLGEHARSLHNAYHGLKWQVHHNLDGHGGAYLLGTVHQGPLWYYFLLALTMKSSPTLLLLPLLVAACRPRALCNGACLAALVLLAYTPLIHVQTGVRLVLPAVALAAVGLAAALVQARRQVVIGAAVVGVLWSAWSAAAVWPHGLRYTNEFWGGSAEGYRCLSDSNYDWGQGLKELTRWQREHGLERMDVWYFGTDVPLRSLPLHNLHADNLPLFQPADVPAHLQERYLAVSASILYGATIESGAATLLHSRRPAARTTTFFIYDVSDLITP
jgi:hypothetical protein